MSQAASMSSRAFGERRYSTLRRAMLFQHFTLEPRAIERLRCAALFPFNERGTNRLDIGLARLIPTNQIADILAVVRVPTRSDPSLDPAVLLISDGNGFARGAQLSVLGS